MTLRALGTLGAFRVFVMVLRTLVVVVLGAPVVFVVVVLWVRSFTTLGTLVAMVLGALVVLVVVVL